MMTDHFSSPALADRVDAFRQRWRTYRARRAAHDRALRELSTLSDRELNDLGISRGTIFQVAYEKTRI